MKRITVDLEEDLYRELKIYCATHGLEIAPLIRRLLVELFEKSKKKKPTK